MRTIRTTKTIKQVFFTSTCELNHGSICFTIDRVIDKQEQVDGTFTTREWNRCTKSDSRRFTDAGRSYFLYENEVKFEKAIKRYSRKLEEMSLSEGEVFNY